jgi:hypothetical protein
VLARASQLSLLKTDEPEGGLAAMAIGATVAVGKVK